MRTLYVAGPMRGYPLSNFPAFDAAAQKARDAGWHVLNPADLDREAGEDGIKSPALGSVAMDAIIDRDVSAIRSLASDEGDAIAMLPGWQNSLGATAELALARWMRLRVLDAITLEDLIQDAPEASKPYFPSDPAERKRLPLATGVIDYFPRALIAIAACSQAGNDQHNPGTPLHWDRAKSGDESDALMRHFIERGTLDKDGIRHSAHMAWRALALLEKELESA